MRSTLGTFIRHRRLQLGLSQHALADRAGHGTTQIHISRLESGATALPRWHRLLALAVALEVTPGDLLLRAGLVTAEDLQGSAGEPGRSAPVTESQPRAEIRSPVGVIRAWETATVFTCA
jgi:transcriptional regulator with XRE-family HTH domain